MKKLVILILALIPALSLTLAFAACGDSNNGGGLGDITITVPGNFSTPGDTSTPGQTESQTQQPGGTDPKLIGSWNHVMRDMTSFETISGWYIFHEDGTFKYSTTWKSRAYYGKYSAFGGKIHFSDVWWFEYLANGEETEPEKRSDVVFEYDFGVNADGEYLLIFALERQGMDETYWDITGAYEFLRKDG